MDAYWRASNYLSVGQIYLLDNPLLKEPLKREHVKPRLLGHWGTSPGLNMICVHLNRVIKRDDLDMIYIIGPGHGGPSLVAHAYLEGTYSEVYPNIGQNAEGDQSGSSSSSASPAASRATSLPKRRAPFMKAASSAMRSAMRTARRSTIPISSSPASSATARRRPVRSRPAGTATSS